MGRLHVLDSSLSLVQILDAASGAYIDHYASICASEGQIYLPLDIVITANNQTMVTNNGNHRIDIILDRRPLSPSASHATMPTDRSLAAAHDRSATA